MSKIFLNQQEGSFETKSPTVESSSSQEPKEEAKKRPSKKSQKKKKEFKSQFFKNAYYEKNCDLNVEEIQTNTLQKRTTINNFLPLKEELKVPSSGNTSSDSSLTEIPESPKKSLKIKVKKKKVFKKLALGDLLESQNLF